MLKTPSKMRREKWFLSTQKAADGLPGLCSEISLGSEHLLSIYQLWYSILLNLFGLSFLTCKVGDNSTP